MVKGLSSEVDGRWKWPLKPVVWESIRALGHVFPFMCVNFTEQIPSWKTESQ